MAAPTLWDWVTGRDVAPDPTTQAALYQTQAGELLYRLDQYRDQPAPPPQDGGQAVMWSVAALALSGALVAGALSRRRR